MVAGYKSGNHFNLPAFFTRRPTHSSAKNE